MESNGKLHASIRHIIVSLFLCLSLFSCGNLLNDEALNQSDDDSNPDITQPIEFKTVLNNSISTVASINLNAEYSRFSFTGSIINSGNIENIWFNSLNNSGEKISESVIISDKHTRVVSQITDTDGNFILVCNEFDPETYDADILIFKISSDRTINWSSRLSCPTSTYALDSAILSDSTIVIASQSYDPDDGNYVPLIIKFSPSYQATYSYKLNFTINSGNNRIYPVPLKITAHSNDTVTISGFFIDPASFKSRLSVVKLNAAMELTAKYNLIEPAKNLTVLDVIHENKVMDVFLICKSDTLFGRDEGFTLLKVANSNSIKFENDYIISDFIPADDLITDGEGQFSVGGYTRNGTNNYSVSRMKFNYSGYMTEYNTLETGIFDINKLVFSTTEFMSAVSYIYTCNSINAQTDGTIIIRQVTPGAESGTKSPAGITTKGGNKASGTLNPVDFQDIDVDLDSFDNFTVDNNLNIIIEWM